MKKVIINCISNYNMFSRYHIVIYDKYKTIVLNKISKSNKVQLYLNIGIYKVVITPLDIYSSILFTSIIVKDNTNYYSFCLVKNDNSLNVTFILVDKKYNNLPIERGKIKLWQDHIQ